MDSPKRKTNEDEYIVAAVIIIILIFCVYLIFISEIGKVEDRIDCAPGQCITNIFTGVKECPSDERAILSIDPTNEVCNSPFTCEDPTTPFAVQSDGSTNSDGICQDKTVCRCLQKARCANYVTAYFRPFKGNPFQPITNQRIVFEQITSYIDQVNNFQEEPPLTIEENDFCAVPKEWVDNDRIWPSACVRGTLAYVPEDPATFNDNVLDVTPVSCVQGSECPANTIPYWDNRVNSLRCFVS